MTAIPTLADTLAARKVVARHHPRTGLYRSAPLSRRFDCDFYVKYETHAPIRSFKARGALYRLSRLTPDEAARGVVTASTGNHGQGIAFAGGRLGISSVVVIPEGTPRVKVEAMRDLGADLRVIGADLTASH
jgi:threonine dehydratase